MYRLPGGRECIAFPEEGREYDAFPEDERAAFPEDERVLPSLRTSPRSSSCSVEEDSSKLASTFHCILKEGEAPLPNQALGATAAARMFCYYYLSLA